jgi:type IV pilus assembly protein PilQ
VVIANNDFARDLGVRFGYSNLNANTNTGKFSEFSGTQIPGESLTPTRPFLGDGVGGLAERADGVPTQPTLDTNIAPLIVNLPVTAAAGSAQFLLGRIGSYLLQLELTAMQREGRGEIVSSPRVVTSDQHKASIKVGQEVPYQESSASGRTTVAFKEAALILDVTPHITPDDRIIMDLRVNKDNPDYTRSIEGVPPIDTRSVETSVLVDNGETVVLGGVYEREKTFQKEQVPWLGDLPVLGNLFKTTNRRDLNNELLIFVTPKILKGDLAGR